MIFPSTICDMVLIVNGVIRKHFTAWASAGYYEEVNELWKENKAAFFFQHYYYIRS
jgi:hypothetical protein